MQRNLVALIIISLCSIGLRAQDAPAKEIGWKKGAVLNLNTSQTSLTNWAAGGQSSISVNGLLNAHLNYIGQTVSWDNTLDLGYGMIKQGDKGLLKSDDKIEFNSKFGKPLSEKLLLSGLVNFKSQMTEGYLSPEDQTVISDFLSPGYLVASVGLDAKLIEGLSLFVGPVTGKITIVNNPVLSAAGSFGVDPGQKMRSEFGGYIRAAYTKEILKNVNLQTKADLFSNYLKDPQYIDVNWEVLMLFKVNEFLSASINTQLIYDHDIQIGKDTSGDGMADDFAPRIQFKEILGIGLTFKF
jgi:hypothetical protein